LAMKDLAKLVKTFGFALPRSPDRLAIQSLLQAIEGKDCELAINLIVLRSLEKATYAPLHVGHYALASRSYCHFTSPIRRYADLLAHRAIQDYLGGRVDQAKRSGASLDLADIGRHITFTEQCAQDAENDLKAVLILQMLAGRMGDLIDGVVTGVTHFGVFIQCRKFGIEGLVRLSELGPDQWRYQAQAHCIVGERSGLTIRLGQPMKVRILAINVAGRQLSLAPVEPMAKPEPTGRPRKAQARTRSRTSRRRR